MSNTYIDVNPEFFQRSSYKEYMEQEQEDNSYGLIYNDLVQEMGNLLEVDIIWEPINSKKTTWFLGGNQDLYIMLNRAKGSEELILYTSSKKGKTLVENMIKRLNLETQAGIEIRYVS